MSKRILVPFGTRPEIIKLAPVVAALIDEGFEVRRLATGQHYDDHMADVFFRGLGLWPDERWELEGDEAERVGSMLTLAYRELETYRPDLVLVLGDTHTVPLFCLAARRYRVPVAHLEAGLRSFNPTSMEETNRRVAAASCLLHFAPTELAARFLAREGVERRRIKIVGNSIIDVLRESGIASCPPASKRGVLLTAHRPTNVDDPERLSALVEIAGRLVEQFGGVRFPVHPRTRKRLEDASLMERLEGSGVLVTEPLSYRAMLHELAAAQLVVTDSGGLQEEAAWFGVPAVVLRRSTPRWESVQQGSAVLAGVDVAGVLSAAVRLASVAQRQRIADLPCPYGDGFTGRRVAEYLGSDEVWDLLKLEEPVEAPTELDDVLALVD